MYAAEALRHIFVQRDKLLGEEGDGGGEVCIVCGLSYTNHMKMYFRYEQMSIVIPTKLTGFYHFFAISHIRPHVQWH